MIRNRSLSRVAAVAVVGLAALLAAPAVFAAENFSTTMQSGRSNFASTLQSGRANMAVTQQHGAANLASTVQTGFGNIAATVQSGTGFSKSITQTGDRQSFTSFQMDTKGMVTTSGSRTGGNGFTSATVEYETK